MYEVLSTLLQQGATECECTVGSHTFRDQIERVQFSVEQTRHSNHDGKIAWVCFAPSGKSCKTLSQDDEIVQQAILALKNPMSSDDISGDRRIPDLEIPLHEQTIMKIHGCESADPALWLDFVNDWDQL